MNLQQVDAGLKRVWEIHRMIEVGLGDHFGLNLTLLLPEAVTARKCDPRCAETVVKRNGQARGNRLDHHIVIEREYPQGRIRVD